MNEPLNNSLPKPNFIGKTVTNHPHWQNQPLRLTKEQKKDPLPVLEEFFQSYHLKDVRELMWNWLGAVITSGGSLSSEPLDRDDHLYFYEKVEALIEVAFVMKGKIQKHRRRYEKRRLKKNSRLKEYESAKGQENVHSIVDNPSVQTVENRDLFSKPKQLLEYVDEDPMYVITEVFKNDPLAILRDHLRHWRQIALSADTAIYEEGEQRGQLLTFYDQLLELTEALFIIYTQKTEKSNLEKRITEADKPRLLSQDQIANPMQVITGFFEKFTMVYIIRELNDWLEAALCFAGTYPDNMTEVEALYTYRKMLYLVHAANRLRIAAVESSK
jgi:hypothetical protein